MALDASRVGVLLLQELGADEAVYGLNAKVIQPSTPYAHNPTYPPIRTQHNLARQTCAGLYDKLYLSGVSAKVGRNILKAHLS